MSEVKRLDRLLDLTEKLIARISNDNSQHGGLLTRETQRTSDELRVALSHFKTDRKDSDDGTEHPA